MDRIYDFEAQRIDGQSVPLAQFAGQVLLIVNTASACGFTPQLAGLQALHQQYAGRGLVVLGFPCNQFGHQDPGSNAEIASFCQRNYGVQFPMMAKIEVNGDGAEPALPLAHGRGAGPAGQQGHQVELHQIPRGPRRPRAAPLRTAGRARQARGRHRGGAGGLTALPSPFPPPATHPTDCP